MSHTVYTGKSGGTTVKIGATAIPRWQQIVIAEKGRPTAETIDTTDSARMATRDQPACRAR